MAAREKLLQAAQSVQTCYSRGWWHRLSEDEPRAAKVIADCVDEWIAGGELAEAYPNIAAFYRGLIKSGVMPAKVTARPFREWINERQAARQ